MSEALSEAPGSPTSQGMAEPLTLTPAAADRIRLIAQRQGKPAPVLRLAVDGGG